MLKPGLLLVFNGRRGVVRHIDRRTGMAAVETETGYAEISSNADTIPGRCEIVANLLAEWPVLRVPNLSKYGAFVRLIQRDTPLTLFVDYVPTSVGVRVSSVFLNPALGVSTGDVLIGQFEKGQARVDVRRVLVTVEAEAKAAEEARKRVIEPEETAYEKIHRMLEEQREDEDDDA